MGEINKQGFANFLARYNPKLFRYVAKVRPDLLGISRGLGATTDTTASGNDWASQLMDVIKTAVAGKAQVDLYKLQTQRAAAGLAPINPASIAPTITVAPSADVAAQVKQVSTVVTWAVVGLAAAVGYKLFFAKPSRR
jgi:hypothetical protein